jgi:spermidine synthase
VPLVVLTFLFFLSGTAALAYQVAWLRMLSLVFGVTVYAASAVLACFMGGLAFGSWLGGRAADRVQAPLQAFAWLEVGVALSALLVPSALEAVSAIYGHVHRFAPNNALAALTVVRLACAGLVLLVPTTLMGASLPLLARYVARKDDPGAARIGLLYAANTAGGIVGTMAAGFTLIGTIGVTATTRIAAALNIMVGVAALVLNAVGGAKGHRSPRSTEPSIPMSRPTPAIIVLVVFLAGFGGLALEVVWFRVLTLFLPATSYAFTTMLGTVLLGITLGSAIAASRVRRSADCERMLGWIQIWTGILVLLSMTALAHTYRMGWRTSGMIQACVVAMLPATLLMGATFPYALELGLGRSSEIIGRRVGVLYALNVCGAVAGSLIGGFALVPFLGTRASLLLLAALYVTAGCTVFLSTGRRQVFRGLLTACVLFAVAATTLPDIYGAILARRYESGERLVFHAEGVQTTATIHHRPPGHRVLYLDGLHQANDTPEMVRVHSEIGQLPMALHRDPKHALVVGVGGGVTAGAVAVHADTSVDVVELSRSVVSAVPYFAHVNGGLLNRPNVRVVVDDGRNFLQLTSRRYDVITADIIQPIHAGAGNLYSIEYFALARRALNDGGLMMQWVGRRQESHYKLIMRTFLQAFPHATLWSEGGLMVGSTEPLRISRVAFERKQAESELRSAFALIGLDNFDALVARFTAGPEEMRRFVGEGPLLSDDRPFLEFHRSLPNNEDLVDVSGLRGNVSQYIDY